MVNILLSLLPRKYRVAYKATCNIFSKVGTWEEVEELSDWTMDELADFDPVLGGEVGKFNGVARWGAFGGKLNIIGSPKRKPRVVASRVLTG